MVSKNYLVKSKRKKNINTKFNSFSNDHIATKKPNPQMSKKLHLKNFKL